MIIRGLAFVGFLLCTLFSFYLHDAILKIMYDSYRKEWIKIGRPLGLLFFNPDGHLARFDIRRWRASGYFSYRLMFWAPEGIYDDSRGTGLLWTFRLLGVLSIVFFLSFFLYGSKNL